MITTASDTVVSGLTHWGLGVMTADTWVFSGLSALASTRVIKSRSVTMPTSLSGGSMISTLPQLARVITQAASHTLAVGPRLSTCLWDMDWKTVRSVMVTPLFSARL